MIKFKKKQKAYMSWENEDDSSIDSDNEEEANLCLMGNVEKFSDSNFYLNDLQEIYDRLLEEFVKASNENEHLKKSNDDLQNENNNLKIQIKSFEKAKTISNNESCESCKTHIHEIDRLNACLAKFNESSKNLDSLLKNQKHVNDKQGVGYDINKASTSKHKNEHKNVRKPIRQPQANKANKVKHQTNRQPPKYASYHNHNHHDFS